MKLQGKTVLVTGAGKRVGRAIALAFAAQGARIAAHYHTSVTEAREVVDACKRLSQADADFFRADLGEPKGPQRLADAVAKRFGGVDILVNSASIYERTPLALASTDEWDRHMAVNARAPCSSRRRWRPT